MTVAISISKFSNGTYPVINGDCAGDKIVNDYFYDLTTAKNIAGDIIDIGILPAYHTISDVILAPDDLDTNVSPALTLDVGLMSGTPGDTTNTRTCGATIFSASTAGQGATVTRASLLTAFNILPTEVDRSIGVKIVAASATAAAGRIRLRVFMHPADHKIQF